MSQTGRWFICLAGLTACTSLLSATLLAQPASNQRSGFEDMSRESQAMQRDDTSNPGMLWVLEGEALWNAKAGNANKSCTDCHRAAEASMRGVAARYPAYDEKQKRPLDLQSRINACRTDYQRSTPLDWESKDLLALSAYIGRQSREMPIDPPDDVRLDTFRKHGERLYSQRQGQLNFSCANCHDANAGQKLASAVIPQGHPNGYPLYRLEWQGLGSLQRRLRGCFVGVRAEPYPYGAQETIDLELFLMSRAKGMPIETPAVRP